MEHCTSKPGSEKEISTWGPDTIETQMRIQIRETIERVVHGELEAASGAGADVDHEFGAEDDRDAAGRCRRMPSRAWSAADIWYVFMDGGYPKVCNGGRRVRVPVLVTLGVANGERVVLDMR